METMTVAELKAQIKDTWTKACEYDGIDEDEKFVCFSPDNPHMARHDMLMKRYQLVQRVHRIGTIGTNR